MQDIKTQLRRLTRPTLLMTAARHRARDYHRARDLRRLVPLARLPGHGQALIVLMENEAEQNAARLAGEAGYTAALHIEMLAAILSEAALFAVALQETAQ